MQFCYGDKNHIRILEEAEFWKRQEAEHNRGNQKNCTGLGREVHRKAG